MLNIKNIFVLIAIVTSGTIHAETNTSTKTQTNEAIVIEEPIVIFEVPCRPFPECLVLPSSSELLGYESKLNKPKPSNIDKPKKK